MYLGIPQASPRILLPKLAPSALDACCLGGFGCGLQCFVLRRVGRLEQTKQSCAAKIQRAQGLLKRTVFGAWPFDVGLNTRYQKLTPRSCNPQYTRTGTTQHLPAMTLLQIPSPASIKRPSKASQLKVILWFDSPGLLWVSPAHP